MFDCTNGVGEAVNMVHVYNLFLVLRSIVCQNLVVVLVNSVVATIRVNAVGRQKVSRSGLWQSNIIC
jgi:hypothetical protein